MSQARLIYRCPVCSQVLAARSLQVDSRGAELCCGGCGVAMRFPPYSDGEEEMPATKPPPDPPNVIAETADPVAPDDPRLLLVDEVRDLDKTVAQAYRSAVAAGDDLQAHRAVLQVGASAQSLADVGQLYRRRAEKIPDDSIAERLREEVLALAMAQMPRSDPEQKKKQTKVALGLVVALFLVMALVLSGLLMARGGCGASPGL